jgi:hypothetical protein
MTSFVLVHPPLLGPAVWGPCAGVLRDRGHRVVVPDLRAAVERPDRWWERAVATVPAGAGGVVVVHSGAGVLMPLLVRRLGADAAVFVDAQVPGEGVTAPSARFREFVAGLPASDGRLPPWPSWWGPEEMAAQVPDPGLRAVVAAEAPAVPVAFYDHAVPAPSGWEPARVGYVRLSPAYAEEEATARARGWRTAARDGRHLDLVTRPEDTSDLVTALT